MGVFISTCVVPHSSLRPFNSSQCMFSHPCFELIIIIKNNVGTLFVCFRFFYIPYLRIFYLLLANAAMSDWLMFFFLSFYYYSWINLRYEVADNFPISTCKFKCHASMLVVRWFHSVVESFRYELSRAVNAKI